jgi:ATP-binding cassette subfamily F protein 3
VLLEALMKYTGTVVFVSHDRYFIDKLATRVFEIGDGKVEIYPGNYEDFLWRKQVPAASRQLPVSSQFPVLSSQSQPNAQGSAQRRNADGSHSKDAVAIASAAVPNGDGVAAGLLAAESKAKRLNPIKRQQMEDRLHEIEEEIARAEAAIALCEAELQSFVSAEETQRQTQELANHKTALQNLMKEWEELSGTLQ